MPELQPMLGIVTSYHGPSNTRGSFMEAEWADKHYGGPLGYRMHKVKVGYDSAQDTVAMHRAAAEQLLSESLRFNGFHIVGYIDSHPSGYMFVLAAHP